MRKDPTEWRNGFKRWKETGESPWEAGRRKELPRFAGGTTPQVDWKYWDNKESSDYIIPFIQDKAVKLTNAGIATGAVLSTNMLDSIADNADRAGLDLQTALGLAVKESTLGNPTDDRTAWNLSSAIRQLFNNKYPGTYLHINDGKERTEQHLINYHKGDIDPKIFSFGNSVDKQSILQTGFEFYKQHPDKYNPGQKNYQRLVDKRGIEVMGSPEVLKWLKKRNLKKAIGRFNRINPLLNESKFNLPKFRLGTEGELNMGERKLLTLQLLSEVSKSTIHEQPVSNTDPVGEFIVNSVGATKGARIIGDILKKARLGRMADTYRLIRKFDSDKQQYTGKSLRKENIRFADKMARESFTLSRPENPLYWIMDPIVAGYSKLLSHPIIGPLIPF